MITDAERKKLRRIVAEELATRGPNEASEMLAEIQDARRRRLAQVASLNDRGMTPGHLQLMSFPPAGSKR